MAAGGPRMTIPTQLVLRALLEDPSRELYGVEIGAAAGLPSGTVHPILARLEGLRWLESRWEDIDTRAAGRPARRYYRLTAARGGVGSRCAGPGLPAGAGGEVQSRHGADVTAAGPGRWCCRIVVLAAGTLPAEHRQRYALEFVAELYGMPRRQQVRHSFQVLSHAWALRAAVADAGGVLVEERPVRQKLWFWLLCHTGRHRWQQHRNPELGGKDAVFELCVRCGRERQRLQGAAAGRRPRRLGAAVVPVHRLRHR